MRSQRAGRISVFRAAPWRGEKILPMHVALDAVRVVSLPCIAPVAWQLARWRLGCVSAITRRAFRLSLDPHEIKHRVRSGRTSITPMAFSGWLQPDNSPAEIWADLIHTAPNCVPQTNRAKRGRNRDGNRFAAIIGYSGAFNPEANFCSFSIFLTNGLITRPGHARAVFSADFAADDFSEPVPASSHPRALISIDSAHFFRFGPGYDRHGDQGVGC